MKELYKDCQKDYEKNLDIYLSENSTELEKKKAYDNIFIDFKTYCFNKIRKMKPFLPVNTVDDWATEIVLNAIQSIKNKGMEVKESWPINMGGYLSWFCLTVNNAKKFNPEKNEIDIEVLNKDRIKNKGEVFMNIEGIGNIDNETGEFVIKEAVKMTVINDGYSMLDIDRAVKLYTKYNGKIGRFSKKNFEIINTLEKNMKTILAGGVEVKEELV